MNTLLRRAAAVAAIAFACAAFAGASQARAEVEPAGHASAEARAKSEARAHFERGVQLGESGSYRESAAEFSRAYQLSPHYAVLYNLAQAYIALGRPVEAVDTLQRYLTEGGANVAPARRSEVQATMKQQQSRVGTVTIDANVEGAVIVVDGVNMGRSPLRAPLRLGDGEHTLTAVLEGYRAKPRTITIAGEEKTRVALVLERAVAAGNGETALSTNAVSGSTSPPRLEATAAAQPEPLPPLAPSAESEPPENRQETLRRTAGYAVGAAGLAVGGIAVAHYLWNKSRFDAYERAMLNDEQKASSIRNASILTGVLAIGGGALLATGIVLVVTATPSSARATAQAGVLVGPGAIAWRTDW